MFDMTLVLPYRTQELTVFFQGFPIFASVSFYLVFISLGYWCWKKEIFKHLAILLCLSTMLNILLKIFFRMPRPAIQHLVSISDIFSFPSGDVQIVTTVWLAFAYYCKQPLLWLLSLALIVLVGLSRVYLGVHDPMDIITGFGVGALLFLIYLLFTNPQSSVALYFNNNKLHFFLSILILVGLYVIAILPDLNLSNGPATWLCSGGTLLGIMIGIALDDYFKYSVFPETGMERFISGFFGLTSVLLLRSGLKALLSDTSQFLNSFFIYMILGVYIIFLVPFLLTFFSKQFRKIQEFLSPSPVEWE